jgi:hypothetical protein
MKYFLILVVAAFATGCEKRPDNVSAADQPRSSATNLAVGGTNMDTRAGGKLVDFSLQDKLILTATNQVAVEAVMDWLLRDKSMGKVTYDPDNIHRSSIVFSDGMKLHLVDNVIRSITTSNGQIISFEYDILSRQFKQITFPDGSIQEFSY